MLQDRIEAGILLAKKLKGMNLKDPLILAIPRGGVILGYEIAERLHGDLDIVTPRKLKDEYDTELAIGAVMPDGSLFLNEEVIRLRSIPDSYIEMEKNAEIKESLRRLAEYRGGREYPEIKDRIVILVDDGIATGATMIAAARWVRKKDPKYVIIAVPVIPAEMLDMMGGQADKIVYLDASPFFFGIGQFYRDFPQVEDSEVIRILKSYWKEGNVHGVD